MDNGYLNEEQLKAVTSGDGPLLIIAGAGTGKTEVITRRILYLIEEKKIEPEEILAITFTEKATNEMLERVDQALPLGAKSVCIKTFHGFCDMILRENGEIIGIKKNYTILTKLEECFFIKKHFFELPLKELRPIQNPFKYLEDIILHISRLKDEDIKPEIYEREAELKELGEFYKIYQEKLKNENLLTFADLIHYTLRLLEVNPEMLLHYQEKWKHILVDEFQDTNFAQNKLINLLAQKHKNVTVVGDDDQSIYKWRGASLSNILNFEKNFLKTKKIVLNCNYRSPQNILSVSHAIIQSNNPYRLEIQENVNKKLKADTTKKEEALRIIHSNHSEAEIKFIIDEIEDLYRNKNTLLEECAILVRARNNAISFIEEIKKRSLPYQFIGDEKLFSYQEIKDIIAMIRFMSDTKDDIAVFRMLHIKIFGFNEEIISYFVDETKKKKITLFEYLKEKELSPSLLAEEDQKIKKFIEITEKLLKKNEKTSAIIGTFLSDSKYLENYIKTYDNEAIENIAKLSEIITQFEEKNSKSKAENLYYYLKSVEELGIHNIQKEEDKEREKNGIQICTVHAAKGLEFDHVYIVNLVNERFPCRRKGETFKIPLSLIREPLPEKDMHIEEERRLFYVACTRAKKKLTLSYSEQYDGSKKIWKKSIFIEEALKTGLMEEIHIDQKNHKNKILITLYDRPQRNIKNYSFSQLSTFETCPHQYKLSYLWKLKTEPSFNANFGISMHLTLRDFYEALKKSKKNATEKNILKIYEKNWISEGYINEKHEFIRKKSGEEILQKFFESNKNAWTIPKYLEKNFRLNIEGCQIFGRIDRIDQTSNGYELIDYKTGKTKSQNEADKDLQLSIYALACKECFGIELTALTLYYLEENTKITTTRNKEKLEETKKRIKEVIERIDTSHFPPTPGYICQFCDFRLLCNAV
ncbi:UvrD-helicase domain-containing protein [Candidatus Peregrinibacteria bacterium]|nr:UvrD-helicase domain-containing protein [Candidatus Peregrinibacteria bacterium]